MSHDESCARTYEERKAQRLRECGIVAAWEAFAIELDETVASQRREIRRLRRALREIAKNRCQFEWDEDGVAPDCECGACIATRALKGTK